MTSPLCQTIGDGVAAGSPERFGLGFAARFGQRRGKVGEQYGQKQPKIQRYKIRNRNLAR